MFNEETVPSNLCSNKNLLHLFPTKSKIVLLLYAHKTQKCTFVVFRTILNYRNLQNYKNMEIFSEIWKKHHLNYENCINTEIYEINSII